MRRLFLFAVADLFTLCAHAANPQLEVKTSQGTLTIELFADKAPTTVENFLQYAKDGFFDGTVFHRVIPGFMIQGGGMTPDLKEKPTRSTLQGISRPLPAPSQSVQSACLHDAIPSPVRDYDTFPVFLLDSWLDQPPLEQLQYLGIDSNTAAGDGVQIGQQP